MTNVLASVLSNAILLGNSSMKIALAKINLTPLSQSEELAAHGALVDKPILINLRMTGLTMVKPKSWTLIFVSPKLDKLTLS